jgi:hypothetical protein
MTATAAWKQQHWCSDSNHNRVQGGGPKISSCCARGRFVILRISFTNGIYLEKTLI